MAKNCIAANFSVEKQKNKLLYLLRRSGPAMRAVIKKAGTLKSSIPAKQLSVN
jgi:hypothetical protein